MTAASTGKFYIRPCTPASRNGLAISTELYRDAPALHQLDSDPAGFEWIDCNDTDASVVSLMRRGRADNSTVVVVCNFTPVPRQNYRVGVPRGGWWRERLNSDARDYSGSGIGNMGGVEASPLACHGRPFSLTLSLPPLSILFMTNDG